MLERGNITLRNTLARYRPKQYEGNVILLINEEWNGAKPGLGWSPKICPSLTTRVVPGGHETRFSEHSEEFARILLSCID